MLALSSTTPQALARDNRVKQQALDAKEAKIKTLLMGAVRLCVLCSPCSIPHDMQKCVHHNTEQAQLHELLGERGKQQVEGARRAAEAQQRASHAAHLSSQLQRERETAKREIEMAQQRVAEMVSGWRFFCICSNIGDATLTTWCWGGTESSSDRHQTSPVYVRLFIIAGFTATNIVVVARSADTEATAREQQETLRATIAQLREALRRAEDQARSAAAEASTMREDNQRVKREVRRESPQKRLHHQHSKGQGLLPQLEEHLYNGVGMQSDLAQQTEFWREKASAHQREAAAERKRYETLVARIARARSRAQQRSR